LKVLLNTVCLDIEGGVSNYYSVVRPFLGEGVEYFTVGARGQKGILGVIVRMLKDYLDFLLKLRNGNYDLVHINPSLRYKAIIRDGIFLLIAKAMGEKVIVFAHGWDNRFERVLRQYFLGIFRMTYMKADAFIVLSSEFREKLIDMGYRNLVFIETTAIDDGIFTRTDETIPGTGKPSQNGEFNILFLSRIERAKGIYEAIDAFAMLRSAHDYAKLTVAGNGGELSNARAYVLSREIEGVEFTGYLRGEAKRKVFSRADVYLLPTYGEGMPISVLEAMAYGLPVITRPVGGIRDFFEDGKMGFVTESRSPEVFAQLLKNLAVDQGLRSRISAYNIAYAKDHFLASKVASRIKEIYKKVIAPPVVNQA
jgi:glycosyltransferase involved in cell wall biosynthesis